MSEVGLEDVGDNGCDYRAGWSKRAATWPRKPPPWLSWNRFVVEVEDLVARVIEMRQAGLRFRNDVVVGPGGKQIFLEDPDGDLVELFEAAR